MEKIPFDKGREHLVFMSDNGKSVIKTPRLLTVLSLMLARKTAADIPSEIAESWSYLLVRPYSWCRR